MFENIKSVWNWNGLNYGQYSVPLSHVVCAGLQEIVNLNLKCDSTALLFIIATLLCLAEAFSEAAFNPPPDHVCVLVCVLTGAVPRAESGAQSQPKQKKEK